MKLEKGKVIDVRNHVAQKEGYTISKAISPGILLFSLGKNTDISAETHFEDKLFYVYEGKVTINDCTISTGEVVIMEREVPIGFFARENTVLLEISIKGEVTMNLEKGKVFELKDLVDYVDGSIANFDVVKKPGMKLMLLSFDEGEGLAPHAAPGDALVMALEGKAKLTMGDKEGIVEAGQQFVFAKNELHSVKALTKFKMALLLVMD